MFRLSPIATKTIVAKGNKKFAGKLANTWTIGWAKRASLGFMPIFTPIGTQISVETIDQDHDAGKT